MNCKKFRIEPFAVVALMTLAGASQAAITVVTTQAAFTAATSAPGTDTYTGLSIITSTPSPIVRSAGAYIYTATGSGPGLNSFFGAGTTANPFLSTNSALDSINFSAFSAGVAGVAGNFFSSSLAGLASPGDVILIATDASGSVTQTIVGSSETSFLGFVSTTGLTSLQVCAKNAALAGCAGPTGVGIAPFLWPSVDNFTLAKAPLPVPEPSTYAMLLAGLGAFGFMARRRRS